MMGSTIKNSFITCISVLSLLLIWKIVSIVVGADIIMPSPEGTVVYLFDILSTGALWASVTATVIRVLVSFLVSCFLGILLGFAAGFNKAVFNLMQPLMTVIRSTPVISIILLALIWFSDDIVPVFVSFLVVFPIICGNVIEGIKNVDYKLVQMAQVYKVKRWRIIYELYFPSILPYLIAGASTAMGINWKAVIAAEVLSQPRLAVGSHMETAKVYLETTGVFAWTFIAVLLSFFFELLLRRLQRRLESWK